MTHTMQKLRAIRKRGADMTQALLYAAFAIGILIAVLAVAQVVTLSSNKTSATRLMSMASGEARTLYRNSDDFSDLTSAKLIEAGAVPSDSIEGTVIKLPYGGTVDFAPNTGDPTTFDATVEFEANTRNSRALCTFLATGETGVIITGPMGSEYQIQDATVDCDNATTPTFTVTYER